MVVLVCGVMLCGCKKSSSVKRVPVSKVERGDFREDIIADGDAQSKTTRMLVCPPEINGKIQYLVEDGSYVHEGDTLCIIESEELDNSLDELEKALEELEGQRVKTDATFHLEHALQTAKMESNIAVTQIASLDSLQLRFSPPLQRRIKELNLRRAAIEKEKCRKALEALEIYYRMDIQSLSKHMDYIHRRIADVREVQDALVMRAPQNGLALVAYSMNLARPFLVGDEVWNGIPIVSIPDVSNMQVQLYVPENDYKRINVDDSVSFTFSADTENQAWGHIVRKMPVGKESNAGSRYKLFEVTAAIDSSLAQVMPQSSVHCRIRLRLVRDTLVVPAVSIFDVDSSKVVYVRMPSGYVEQHEVEVACSSLTTAVLARGVEEDDELLLLRPADNRIRRKVYLSETD